MKSNEEFCTDCISQTSKDKSQCNLCQMKTCYEKISKCKNEIIDSPWSNEIKKENAQRFSPSSMGLVKENYEREIQMLKDYHVAIEEERDRYIERNKVLEERLRKIHSLAFGGDEDGIKTLELKVSDELCEYCFNINKKCEQCYVTGFNAWRNNNE